MSFALYYHPLSSFCWKALIALYEADIAFEARLVNLGDPADRAAFQAVWPLAKFPVLRDNTRGKTIPESSVVIDYLARTEPRAASLVPGIPSWRCRPACSIDSSTTTSTRHSNRSLPNGCAPMVSTILSASNRRVARSERAMTSSPP
ncbi:Glutathione S-transferase, N-terminal domain [Variovorax sp. YR750]|uniref:glutathione S-transferase family protein n=1 Tax=Variovorax sp. YR750 TaxID=1884384 RepID=UPI0008BFD93C|nr:glutathione S-transferase N-terminal domain-containing protein [Variovorax sp. YR750]SEM06473.1 Glutathione S-transferase, N-terminal domain [Variovorax sp. YR750]